MPVPTCEHLEDYGVLFVRAEAAYRAMLAQVDAVAAGAADDGALDLLEKMLFDWRDEVAGLRRRLVEMVKLGRVVLPDDGAAATADRAGRCGLCGEPLPRLVFPDFAPQGDGAVVYRGAALPVLQPMGR